MDAQKTIVISGVNIVVGGTLTILRDCLFELSQQANTNKNLRIIALVHSKELAYFENIEYIEMKWSKKYWVNRLWAEYVSMRQISNKVGSVYLWFSLHDTTPNVVAKHRAVYCHNSFSFYRWKVSDIRNNYKVVMFSIFTKYIYKKNIHKNDFVVVQQPWFKSEFKRMFNLDDDKLIVSYPTMEHPEIPIVKKSTDKYQFFFPSSLGVHKNFELICKAATILEKKGVGNYEIFLTIDGTKGRYDKSIVDSYKHILTLKFIGFQTKAQMINLYGSVDCLIFPSKMESWGLPISEFGVTEKAMLLADLPYAHTAAQGSSKTAFFNPSNAIELASMMEKLIAGDQTFLRSVTKPNIDGLHTKSWKELIEILIK